MLTDIEATDEQVQQDFYTTLSKAKSDLQAFDPELVVVFGPDHFNGFFYDLMPSYCIGLAAKGTRDYGLELSDLNVPKELALECVRSLHRQDIDVSVSYEMKVDHGITIPLLKLTSSLDHYSVLPVFVNCAADPRPSFRRVRRLGEVVGRFLAETGKRIAVVGSGGLSHDPPMPRVETAAAEVSQRLIQRHTPSQAELDKREARVVKCARELVKGEGPCLPPNESWDQNFLEAIIGFNTDRLDALSDDEVDREAGSGGHEVRTWVAAVAAARAIGMRDASLGYYRVIPEWITGMGVIRGQDQDS